MVDYTIDQLDLPIGLAPEGAHSLETSYAGSTISLALTFSGGAGFEFAAIFAPLVLTLRPEGSLSFAPATLLSPEFFARQANGVRPILPWLVRTRTVRARGDIIDVGGAFRYADYEPFIIAEDFQESPDDPLFALGGKRHYIGMPIIDELTGVRTVRFRPPYLNEVVYVRDEFGAARFERLEEGVPYAWKTYATLPERWIAQMEVFSKQIDPDQVYRYWALILGLVHAQIVYDFRHLGDVLGIDRTEEPFLSLLLFQYGIDSPEFANSVDRREVIRRFNALMRAKGTRPAVVAALRVLGYEGDIRQVWAIPNAPTITIIEKTPGEDVTSNPEDPDVDFFPTPGVTIYLNELDGDPLNPVPIAVRQSVARFLGEYVLPVNAFIRFFGTRIAFPESAASGSIGEAVSITP